MQEGPHPGPLPSDGRGRKSGRSRDGAMRRRRFLGLAGVAGLSWPAVSGWPAQAGAEAPKETVPPGNASSSGQRTDPFEVKLKLLEAAWQRKDFRLVRALTDSLRNTAMQAQAEEESPGKPLAWATPDERVEALPGPWRSWAQGWSYCRAFTLERAGPTEGVPDGSAPGPLE